MYLVTGHKGFLGRAILDQCPHTKEEFYGFDVPTHTIIDPDPWHTVANARAREYGFESSVAQLHSRIKECRLVIHAAAMADFHDADQNKDMAYRINVEGTRNVAQGCLAAGIPMVYISTCCVYGNQKTVWTDESAFPDPTDWYAKTKLNGEHEIAKLAGLKWRICRLATFYGPGMREALFNAVALRAAASNGVIEVDGEGKQTRCYLHVDDAARAIWTIAEHGSDGETYNIAGVQEVSVMETINMASAVTGGKPEVRFRGQRTGQIIRGLVNSSKLRNLGWRQKWEYLHGMKQTWEAMKNHA